MLEELLVWLLAAYGCSSLLVAMLQRVATAAVTVPEQPVHYQVLVCNSADLLEGVVRSLLFTSSARGTPISLSFVDHGSTDDTLRIASVFIRTQPYLTGEEFGPARETITIDLREADRGEQ